MPEMQAELGVPLDIGQLRTAASAAGPCCVVRREWLQRVLIELEAGRAAMALQGLTFSGTKL